MRANHCSGLASSTRSPAACTSSPTTLPTDFELNPPGRENPSSVIFHEPPYHHQFLRNELPRLHVMAARVAKVHGGHTPSLIEVLNVFESLAEELVSHLAKEKEILFPKAEAMIAERGNFFTAERSEI
ncbi:MAG: hemerythrin domain-containing protein [Verrucomicrobiales bacterium]